MSQSDLVICNLLLYVVVFLIGYRFYGRKNIGVFMLFLYALSSFFSFLFFQHSFFVNSLNYVPNGIELEGVLYLFAINMLLVLPFLRLDMYRFLKLKRLDFNLFYKVLFVCSVLYLLQFLLNLPQMAKIGNVDTNMLSDLRNETYESGSFESRSAVLSALSRLLGGIRFLYLFLSIVGYLLDRKRKRFYIVCLVIYGMGFVQTSLLWVARAPLVHEMLVLSTFFIFFFDLISPTVRRKILVYSLAFCVVGFLFILAITYSRFGDNTGNSFNMVSYSLIRYLGEPQINFLGLLYDNTNGNLYGYKSFSLFRRFLGLSYMEGFDKTAHYDYMSNLMNSPSYFLYQLAGSLYADWGKEGTVAFCICFASFIFYLTRRVKEMPIYNLQTILLLSTLVSKGMFYSESSSEKGNLMFVFAFLFYLLCRLGAHYKVIVRKRSRRLYKLKFREES